MKKLLPLLLLFSCVIANAQKKIGIFDGHTDVGAVKIPGKVDFNEAKKEYKIGGSGKNMWLTADEFHFVWKKMEGDFKISAKIRFIGNGTEAHRKAGLIIRHSMEPNTVYADVAVHGDGLTSLQFRPYIEQNTEEVTASIKAPDFIQLEKKGNVITMYASKNGEPLKNMGAVELIVGNNV